MLLTKKSPNKQIRKKNSENKKKTAKQFQVKCTIDVFFDVITIILCNFRKLMKEEKRAEREQ